MLRVWLPLTKDLKNQGLSEVTVTNNGATYLATGGKLGGCYDFDETGISFNNVLTYPCSQFSVAGWVNLNSGYKANNGFHIINFQATYGRICISKDSYAVRVLLAGESQGGYSSTMTASQLSAGVWHHYAITFNSGDLRIYIDGVLDKAQTTAMTYITYTNNTIGIGPYNTELPNGKINDFRLYDHCLSPMEVKQISQGLVLHYPLNRNGIGGENLLTGTNNGGANWQWTMQVGDFTKAEETTLSGVKGCKFTRGSTAQSGWSVIYYSVVDESVFESSTNYTLSVDIYPSVVTSFIVSVKQANGSNAFTTKSDAQSVVPNKWNRIVFNLTTVSSLPSSTEEVIYFSNMNSSTGVSYIFRNLKLEKGDKATPWCPNPSDSGYSIMGFDDNVEYDCSGFGNNGTRVGEFSWSSDTPKYQVSTHVGATNQKIHISNFPTSGFGNSYSFAWWGKRNSNDPMFWGFSDGIRLNGMYTGRLWNTGDSSQNPIYRPNTTNTITAPSINEWHHYVMTGDGTTCKLYLDGELYGQAKTYKAISGTSIYINGWDGGTSYCSNNTDISDFRIYATALSASDVLSLYQNSAYIDSSGNVYGAVHEEV